MAKLKSLEWNAGSIISVGLLVTTIISMLWDFGAFITDKDIVVPVGSSVKLQRVQQDATNLSPEQYQQLKSVPYEGENNEAQAFYDVILRGDKMRTDHFAILAGKKEDVVHVGMNKSDVVIERNTVIEVRGIRVDESRQSGTHFRIRINYQLIIGDKGIPIQKILEPQGYEGALSVYAVAKRGFPSLRKNIQLVLGKL